MTNSKRFLKLPQVCIYGENYGRSPWLLITGGRAPSPDWLKSLPPVEEIFAADHGLDTCKACQINPTYILGDGDSAAPDTWNWGKTLGVPMEEFPVAKDYTDTQLALQKMIKAPVIIITGAFGGRLDHLYSTMFSCSQQTVPCVLCDEQEILCIVRDGESVRFDFQQHPQAISLLPVTESCTGVSLDNVRWPLKKARLKQEMPNAISNELLPGQESLTLSVDQGTLAIYFHYPSDCTGAV
ncbi:thiamine pyrophosphokinase [Selenomonas ruminantium]|uniref:Thiamine diphosphokinase n=1 Tax=Selenomonas ruminantium TaxID=971 RepID=A0A1M6SEL4_SELRU|nr:thiamine diphosphokinase [Selenomonas ruminantium]SHK42938.1 thiamine pyrophosphokinase [Selenomonas ruminantium]